ncbi:hypothetical protein K438DRAFT_1746800 [Mycena galopus ATCC 62051]|nr:hypothetical protein K438DRAFT_1746800 [Mycena galopus ATCC 62051]
MAPTNILVAGSTNGQGVGEWVGNLLWLGCVAAGMFALCIAIVWATQEEQVALCSGGHRRIIRGGSRNPWFEENPPDDGGHWYLVDEDFKTTRSARSWTGEERNPSNVRHDYAKGTRETGTLKLNPSSPGLHQWRTITPDPRQWSSLPTRIHGDPPTPPSEASEIPELVMNEDLEATPPSKERLSTSARTRLDRVHAEMVQGGRQ